MLRLSLALSVAFASAAVAQSILPPPQSPAGHVATADEELLGKALFWDEQLSATRTVACGTCHRFASGGADPRALNARHPGPDGVTGTDDDVHGSPGVVRQDAAGLAVRSPDFGLREQVTRRRAPSVINAAYARALFRDGRIDDVLRDPLTGATVLPADAALENQALRPPVDAVEMSHIGRSWSEVAQDIAGRTPLALASNLPPSLAQFVAGQTYAGLFARAFGSPGVTPTRIAFALAAYERTLISDQSPFDLFLAGQGSLGVSERAGLTAFLNFCSICHTDVLPQVLVTGPVLDDYRNVGVRPPAEDEGRAAVTHDPNDRGRFRVPGLRNVALRAPYFHNGGMATLFDVIDFYSRGGDFTENRDPEVEALIARIGLADRFNLERFLHALTDPRVAQELPPFDRPRLWSEASAANRSFGSGTAATGFATPRAAVLAAAWPGNPRFAIAAEAAPPGSRIALCFDTAASPKPTRWAGLDVYLGFTASLIVHEPTSPVAADGTVTARLPLPTATGLSGLTLYAQWFAADPRGAPWLCSSDAIAFTLL